MNVFGCTSSRRGFLILGLWNCYDPGNDQGLRDDLIQEGEGARIARRNNLALAGIVVAAFMAGAGPQDLEVFGVTASGTMGVLTACFMVLACHTYWYFMRWHHLADDAVILVFSVTLKHPPLPLQQEGPRMLSQKSAALFANRACFLLVAMSVAISVWWGVSAVAGGVAWTN
ncbi:MAG: hypothetical protein OXC93_03730 [Rhodospirillaceae bacterium]|nr:hypothetical protein [Rhodospirillaceae bacterium]